MSNWLYSGNPSCPALIGLNHHCGWDKNQRAAAEGNGKQSKPQNTTILILLLLLLRYMNMNNIIRRRRNWICKAPSIPEHRHHHVLILSIFSDPYFSSHPKGSSPAQLIIQKTLHRSPENNISGHNLQPPTGF